VQVDPIKLTMKAPGTNRLKLQVDILLSYFNFNFSLRRCTKVEGAGGEKGKEVGGPKGKGPSHQGSKESSQVGPARY
jgi:hypothetical protein